MRIEDLTWNELVQVAPESGLILVGGARALLIDADALGLLRKELVATLGHSGARGMLTRFGVAHGKNAAETLRRFYWDDLSQWRRAGGRLHTLQGMVRVEPVPEGLDARPSPFADALWKDSYEALEHLKFFGRADEPVCWTLCGFASGYLSHVNGRNVYCFEEKCVGRGDSVCHMVGRFEDELDEAQKSQLRFFQTSCLEGELQRVTDELKKTENRLRARRQALARANVKEANVPLLAQSARMQQLVAQARRAAQMDLPVSLIGPPGVGKERLAQMIHDESPRALFPFLSLHCADWPTSLLESELLGPLGVFHSAAGGTLLLTDLERLPKELQSKLWHHLTRARPVPSSAPPPRLMVASPKPLALLENEGLLHSSLSTHLGRLELHIPALKDRPEDILPLARAFLLEAAGKWGRRVKTLSPGASELLLRYGWPRNVAELKSAMEYAVAMAISEEVQEENLPWDIQNAPRPVSSPRRPVPLAQLEREHILWALEQNHGNREMTAEQLGIGVATLYRKLKSFKNSEAR